MSSLVVDSGEMSGYRYAIVIQSLGHLCAYLAVRPGHPWYALDRLDAALSEVRIHGGVTYAARTTGEGFPVPDDERPAWWVGFDLAREGAYQPRGAGDYPRARVVSDDTFSEERAIALGEVAELVRQASEAARWQMLGGL